jgi:hypothetical protein
MELQFFISYKVNKPVVLYKAFQHACTLFSGTIVALENVASTATIYLLLNNDFIMLQISIV